jgi:YfiH family protein
MSSVDIITMLGVTRASYEATLARRWDGFQIGFCGIGKTTPAGDWVKQVHGIAVREACEETRTSADPRLVGDGLWTDRPNARVLVRTADCLPILLAAPRGRLVMAVHAGWRGLTGGILRSAREVFLARKIEPAECEVVVGPAIGYDAFEIGPEVAEAFRGASLGLTAEQLALCLRRGRGDRWHAHLSGSAAAQLVNLGFSPGRVHVMDACTHRDADVWHSYRREGDGFPMNWSWISKTGES